MCDIGDAAYSLSIYISLLIITGAAIYALFELRRTSKIALSYILVFIAVFHYVYLYLVYLSAINCRAFYQVSIYPLIIIESLGEYSVFYPDIGQLAIILLVLMWRGEIRNYIRKLRIEHIEPSTHTPTTPDHRVQDYS
jgi:hypothetical protein